MKSVLCSVNVRQEGKVADIISFSSTVQKGPDRELKPRTMFRKSTKSVLKYSSNANFFCFSKFRILLLMVFFSTLATHSNNSTSRAA